MKWYLKESHFTFFRNTRDPITSVSYIVRFAPSSCNTQPWIVERKERELANYRYKKEGKRGIMSASKASFYNQIDMGIFLCFLDLCLEHNNIQFDVTLYKDDGLDREKTPVALYKADNWFSILIDIYQAQPLFSKDCAFLYKEFLKKTQNKTIVKLIGLNPRHLS